MSIDGRVRYTKMVIKDCFLKLLKQKPLNKITVKSICEMAQINRATFYKYYQDQFDLLEKIEEGQLKELQKIIDINNYTNTVKTFERILDKIREDIEVYSVIISDNGDIKFTSKIFDIFYEKSKEDISKKFSKISKEKQEWLYYYISYGCSGILKCWIKNSMKENSRELAEYMNDLINKTITVR